jgi:hypothetical protein
MDASEEMQQKIDQAQTGTWLYDPPIDGVTPLNGSGLPSKSLIIGNVERKIKLGFTREPIGVEGEEIPPEVPERLERVGTNKEALRASITRADVGRQGRGA